MESQYPRRSNADLIRWLAIGSLAGQLAWLVLAAVAGLVEPGYSEVRDAVSVLGARNAGRPWLFDSGVAIWGASFILAAIALALDAPRGWRGWLGPGLIALTGLAQILDGFPFPADCRWTIDATCQAREAAGELSWQHYAHGLTYFLGAISLQLSVFAMAWRFRGDARWGRFERFALWAGLGGLVVFGALFFLVGNDPDGYYGLVQRLALAAGGGWVALLCLGLLYVNRSATGSVAGRAAPGHQARSPQR